MAIRLDPALKVMAAGIAALVLTVGISRFGYTPLLPIMQRETWLSDAAGGWLATANYAGYMAGALLASTFGNAQQKFRLYRLGLILAVVTTPLMALTDNFAVWLVLRFIGGLASTSGLLLGSGLVLGWLMQHGRRAELGIHFTGIGLGIALTGTVVLLLAPFMAWTGLWLAFGVLGLALLVPAWRWLPAPVPAARIGTVRPDAVPRATPSRRWLVLMVASYFCAGFGFVISATFTVAITVRQTGINGPMVWILVGLAAIPACLLWDRIARRVGETRALMVAYAIQTLSVLVPALSDHPAAALAGALLYGITFIGIVSVALTLVGRAFPANPAKAMARLTLSYGAAQIVAPALAGSLAQATGRYTSALLITAGVLALGTVLLEGVRRTEVNDAHPG